jgi:hypothetical protein
MRRPHRNNPMTHTPYDLCVLFEHPEWQKPLFAALTRRGVNFTSYDLKRAAFDARDLPAAKLYFNQASPSAYVRGNVRAVPFAMALMKHLERRGARVLNGARAFAFELSKSVQATALDAIGVSVPRSITFNDVEALREVSGGFPFPALVKPDQGGSGARIYQAASIDEVAALLSQNPDLWSPDNLLLLQEYVAYDTARGIVRMEFVGGELLYAMRVVSHGRFNLCPSPVCNPDDGDGVCEIPTEASKNPVEFYPYPDVPAEAVAMGKRIVAEGHLDVAGIEYLDALDGRRVFYDVNANSNLRPQIAAHFGFDPFERVVDFLVRELRAPGY